jgi:plastocyanin
MKKIYVTLSFLLLSSLCFCQASGLFFSEYAEGSSNNKYMEIYNGTGQTVDLSEYAFPNVSNAPSTPGQYEYWNNFPIGASIADGDVYIIAHPSSDPFILAEADHTFNFMSNGDDGFCLVKQDGSWVDVNNDEVMQDDEITGYIFIDWIGSWDADPGSGWDVAGVSTATKDHVLKRKETICVGNSLPLGSFGTTTADSEWEVLAIDTWTNLGSHLANCGGGVSPVINSNPNSLIDFVQFVGSPSDEQTTEVSGSNLSSDITAAVSGDYEISLTTATGFGPSLVLVQTAGEVSATMLYVRLNGSVASSDANGLIILSSDGSDNDTITLSGEILNSDPVLFSSEDTLNGFSHFVGTPSIEQSFEVSGNYLTEDVTIDVTGEFEISLTSNGTFSNSILLPNTGGEIENTNVFVRLNGIADNDNQEGLVTVSSASVPGAFTVNAGNFYYAPTELTINVGDTVYWVNDGGFHNVNFSTNTVTGNPYNNPESFVSNPTSDTEIYSYVFNTAGTYQYDCSVGSHAANGMIGTIIVLENSDPEPGIVVLSGETLDYSSYAIGQVTTNDANGVADSLGLLVSLEGVVHCIDFDGNEGLSFTIIDIDNNGINVYNFNDVSSYVVSEGDLIKVWGVIDQYNGLTEVIPDSIEVLSTGNATVTPSLVTGLNEDTESQWITIQNVDFVTPIATFASGSSNIDVTDGTNVYTLRIDSDTDIPESSTPQGPFDVTGVGGQYDSSDPYDSGYQLFPCGLGSFVPSSTTQLDETMILNVFRAYPNPFNNMIQVSLTQQGAFEIAVMDVQGRILLHESMNQSMNIDTKDWNSGLYMISVQDSKGLVQIQKVIK